MTTDVLSYEQIVALHRKTVRRMNRVVRHKGFAWGWLRIQWGLRDWGLGVSAHFYGFVRISLRVGPVKTTIAFWQPPHD